MSSSGVTSPAREGGIRTARQSKGTWASQMTLVMSSTVIVPSKSMARSGG
jgi:hypothetical protein